MTSLRLTLVRAEQLIAADRNGKSDPYAVIEVLDGEGKVVKGSKQQSPTIYKTLDPEWNADFAWADLAGPLEALQLRVRLYDKDMLTSDALGEVQLALIDFPAGGAELLRDVQPCGKMKKRENLGRLVLRGTATGPAPQPAAAEAQEQAPTSSPSGAASQAASEPSAPTPAPDEPSPCGQSTATVEATAAANEPSPSPSADAAGAAGGGGGNMRLRHTWLMLLRAEDLIAADSNGLSDPYVVMELLDVSQGKVVKSSKRQSKCIKKNLNPTWEEDFEWGAVNAPLEVLALTLRVYDKDMLTSDALGSVQLRLSEFIGVDKDMVLHQALQPFGKMKQRDRLGRLFFRLNLKTTGPSPAAGSVPAPQSSADTVTSAAAAPTDAPTTEAQEAALPPTVAPVVPPPSSSGGGTSGVLIRLGFGLVRAEELIPADNNGLSDPYAILELVDGAGNKAAKAAKKHKSSVKQKSLNPVWNETFEWEDLHMPVDALLLRVKIFDKDTFGSDELGHFELPLADYAMADPDLERSEELIPFGKMKHSEDDHLGRVFFWLSADVRKRSSAPTPAPVLGPVSGPVAARPMSAAVADSGPAARPTSVSLERRPSSADLIAKSAASNFASGKVTVGAAAPPMNREGVLAMPPQMLELDPTGLRVRSMQVTVVCADHLIAADSNGLSDPFVVMEIVDSTKNKPVKGTKKQTTVKKKTLHPTWDEDFSWEPMDLPLSQLVLRLKVFDRDWIKKDELGHVDLQLSQCLHLTGVEELEHSLVPLGKMKQKQDLGSIFFRLAMVVVDVSGESVGLAGPPDSLKVVLPVDPSGAASTRPLSAKAKALPVVMTRRSSQRSALPVDADPPLRDQQLHDAGAEARVLEDVRSRVEQGERCPMLWVSVLRARGLDPTAKVVANSSSNKHRGRKAQVGTDSCVRLTVLDDCPRDAHTTAVVKKSLDPVWAKKPEPNGERFSLPIKLLTRPPSKKTGPGPKLLLEVLDAEDSVVLGRQQIMVEALRGRGIRQQTLRLLSDDPYDVKSKGELDLEVKLVLVPPDFLNPTYQPPADTEAAQARRCQRCRDEGGTRLDFARLPLGNNFPVAMLAAEFPTLTTLDLKRSQLPAVPEALCDALPHLQKFVLSNNHLVDLPWALVRLAETLQVLAIDGNRFTALPPVVAKLTSLTALHAQRNQLTAAGPELGQLTHLRTLLLNNNQLTTVAPEIGQLADCELVHVDLSNNPLLAGTDVPGKILELERKRKLLTAPSHRGKIVSRALRIRERVLDRVASENLPR